MMRGHQHCNAYSEEFVVDDNEMPRATIYFTLTERRHLHLQSQMCHVAC